MINFNVQIRDFPFGSDSQGQIESWKSDDKDKLYGSNWPVVYLIHNDDTHEAYVGETLNAGKRMAQHWQNSERRSLKTIHIVTDDTFNKSVILDLESFLIRFISADGKYTLQNGNTGLSNFDYFNREQYEKQFEEIWNDLKQYGLTEKGIEDIKDSDFFKYSPYKALTRDQEKVLEQLLGHIAEYLETGKKSTLLVEGGAGTGKTILASFLIKLLCDLQNPNHDNSDNNESEEQADGIINKIRGLLKEKKLRIGFVVPQQSLRDTLQKVFRTVNGLSAQIIVKPDEAAKQAIEKPYDLLICDEAHRLRRRAALSQYPAFDKVNERLGLSKETTELEWIIRSSSMQLLFYDSEQSVRPSDITEKAFEDILKRHDVKKLQLTSQLRCLGGDDYIQYIKEVLNVKGFTGEDQKLDIFKTYRMTEDGIQFNQLVPHGEFKDYRLEFYDDLDLMMDEINRLDKEQSLSCAVAGYAWEWKTKKDKNAIDIPIGRGYIWNRKQVDWINSNRLENEIGCIHTVQGYDLNYVGVIFGPEITYNKATNRIEVIKGNYHDTLGKAVGNGNDEALREYILNIYATLLTRGIHGALVYVCDLELREYLRPYFTSK